MIDSMEYLALGIGALFGLTYLRFSKAADWALVVLHYMPYRSENGFYGMYDNADQKSSYEYFKSTNTSKVKSYAEYLKLHQDARPSAYRSFGVYYDVLAKVLLLRIAPITLLPAILFWSNWYYYVIGLFSALIILMLYSVIVQPRGVGARKRLMVFATMLNYLKEKEKPKKSMKSK